MLNIQKSYSPSISAPSGFTLMELMTIVSIIAILAAIALPSYRQYTVKNAESQAQAKMRQLQIELDSWRANALTYKGFQPKKVASNGTINYAYDTVSGATANTQILVPDTTNPRYTITLLDGGTANTSLVPTSNSTTTVDLTSINPNGWRMVAVPNTTLAGYGASNIILTSKGLACKSKTSMTSTITTCPTGATVW